MTRTPALLCFLLALSYAVPASAEEGLTGYARWKESIAAFVERDHETPPKKGAILFVGSSSIRLWELAHSWPDTATVNNGFGGSTLADSIFFFDQVIAPYEPSAIVIYAGDNDIAKGLTPEEVQNDFSTLADKIEETHPDVPVVYIAIKPSQKRWDMWEKMKKANDLIAADIAEREDFRFADIAAPMLANEQPPPASWFVSDGLHLSPEGYEGWTEVVKTEIEAASKE